MAAKKVAPIRRGTAPGRKAPSSYTGIQQSIRKQSRQLLTTGRRFERFDQIRQRHFWSTVYYAADATGYVAGTNQLFITPPGQNGQGFPSGVTLTERETNWKSANRVPDNQNFEVTELGVSIIPIVPSVNAVPGSAVPSALLTANMLQNTVLSITYLTNSVPLGMTSDFAQAAGPMGGDYQPIDFTAAVAGTIGRVITNGFAAPALRRRLKIPILLQHGETFSFQFDIPRAVFLGIGAAAYMRMDFFATESFAEKS